MANTVVISIKPFNDYQRHELDAWSLGWAIRALISGELTLDSRLVNTVPEDYTNTPVIAVKPHWFKRLYSKALARFTLSWRVTVEQASKLKSIIGWQDKLRRYMSNITTVQKTASNVPELSSTDSYFNEYDTVYDLPDDWYDLFKTTVENKIKNHGVMSKCQETLIDELKERRLFVAFTTEDLKESVESLEYTKKQLFAETSMGVNPYASFLALLIGESENVIRTVENN